MNQRAVSGSAGTLAGEKFHGQLAGKGAGALSFMGSEEILRLARVFLRFGCLFRAFISHAADHIETLRPYFLR